MANLTTQQRINKIVKECSGNWQLTIILMERLECIANMTQELMDKKPESFDNALFHREWYSQFCNIVKEHGVSKLIAPAKPKSRKEVVNG